MAPSNTLDARWVGEYIRFPERSCSPIPSLATLSTNSIDEVVCYFASFVLRWAGHDCAPVSWHEEANRGRSHLMGTVLCSMSPPAGAKEVGHSKRETGVSEDGARSRSEISVGDSTQRALIINKHSMRHATLSAPRRFPRKLQGQVATTRHYTGHPFWLGFHFIIFSNSTWFQI